MSILARRQLRLAAAAVIATITGITVNILGDWSIPPSKLPSIRLRAPLDRKVSVARTLPEFTTTVTLQLMATVQAKSDALAQDAIDALGQQIEYAFFRAPQLVKLCQQFSTVTSEVEITADGEQHVATLRMSVDCEVFEAFDPYDPTAVDETLFPGLAQLNINVDTAQPFDKTGTYDSPPFPDSVAPAPRTSGPDGRNEGTLQIDLST